MSSLPSVTSRLQGGPERRRHIRCRILERQLVTVGLGQDRRGLLVDISESGAAVQPYTELRAGDTSQVRFQLPGSTATIEARGVVSWVGPTGRAGIRFVAVHEDSHERLRRWIDGLAPALSPASSATAALATAAYLPPSYSPWVRMSDLNLEPSPLGDDVANLDLVSALRLVVERSRTMTHASGAAIALADKEEMVCRARTGVAPDLGARFRPDSGLSGEAVRTAKAVRCSDTGYDLRVDRLACERLNVRSIVITPILSSAAVIGVIEVFSPKVQAFDERDELHLRRMAELVAAMLENSIDHLETGFLPDAEPDLSKTPTSAASSSVPEAPELTGTPDGLCSAGPWTRPAHEPEQAVPDQETANNSSASLAAEAPVAAANIRTSQAAATAEATNVSTGESATRPSTQQIEEMYRDFMQQASDEDRRRGNKTIAVVMIVLALAAAAATAPYWFPRKRAATPPTPARVVPLSSASQPQSWQELPSPSPVVSKPSAAVPQPVAGPAGTQPRARGERWTWMAPTKPGTGSELKLKSPRLRAPDPAPEMTGTPGQVKVINDMVGSWGEAESSAPGGNIVEGRLISRVDPIFPPHVNHAAARGRVVVQIGIDKTGRVERTEPISGDPTLTAAAVQAIRQWRYEPYQLDGQPIAVEKTITIDFAGQR